MFPFNATFPDGTLNLPRRRVADCYDHMETRLYITIDNNTYFSSNSGSLSTSLMFGFGTSPSPLRRFFPFVPFVFFSMGLFSFCSPFSNFLLFFFGGASPFSTLAADVGSSSFPLLSVKNHQKNQALIAQE